MGTEREREPSDEGVEAGSHGSGAKEEPDPRGPIQSAKWTTSTYRSSRKLSDVPGKASKPTRKKPPVTDAPDEEPADEEPADEES